MRVIAVLVLCFLVSLGVTGQRQNASVQLRPNVVNIGALYTFNSTIGKVAHAAIAAAVDDVNADSSVLPGTTLNIITQDTNCSGFIGTIEGMRNS